MNKRLHVVFSGHVQGVGFRFTARSMAKELRITGWVRNCPDGSVETVVEGEQAVLSEFLMFLENEFHGYVRGKQVEWGVPTGEFADFGIRM